MTSTVNQSSLKNLSLCVYIGNIAAFDDQILINYCAQFGEILSCSILNCSEEKRSFIDFRIIEFARKQQFDYFLSRSVHQIGSIILEVKSYEHLLANLEILNLDRKIFIGPVLNTININTIVQFYKLIDRNLNYCLSRQNHQTFLLIECSNRQYTRTIIQQQTIPQTFDNQIFTIHLPIHPKELLSKQTSTRNYRNQICIKGLTDRITENLLIDYFEKRALVIGCYLLATDPKCAIIEFENEKIVQKFLDFPSIRLHGANLSLSKVPEIILATSIIENNGDINNEEIDQLLETNISHPPAIRKEPLLSTPPPPPPAVQKVNIPPPAINTEPSSPEIRECGWASPPRAVILDHCSPSHHPSERLSSKPTATMSINIDQGRVMEIDTKPLKNVTNNRLPFVEQFQNEIDQIKEEYLMKFTRDRTSIEEEINRLMNDERITLGKLQRYLHEQRKRPSKLSDHKRKHC